MAHDGVIRIRRHMLGVLEYFRQQDGQINPVTLAECSYIALNGWCPGDDVVPEAYLNMAGRLALADRLMQIGTMPASTRGFINQFDASYF